MLILVNSYGDHSARLFQNLHIDAFCMENNIPYVNATFFDMAWLFSFPYEYWFAFILILLFKLTHVFRYFDRSVVPYIDCTDTHQLELYKQHMLHGQDMLVFVGGWSFRVHDLVLKYSDVLKKKYSIKRENPELSAISEKIKEYDVVIGVHIRRGDYRKWHDGKYAFDDLTFNRFVRDTVALHGNKKIFVLYFSNEKLDFTSLHCPADHYVSKNNYYIDYQLMGKCNYLIGPPSTFTLWASFLYGVPCLHLQHAEQEIRLDEFKIHTTG
jgi:hypothetical protein